MEVMGSQIYPPCHIAHVWDIKETTCVLLVALFSVFHMHEQWDGTGQCGGVADGHPGNVGAGHPDNVGAGHPGNLGAGHPDNLGAGRPDNLFAAVLD